MYKSTRNLNGISTTFVRHQVLWAKPNETYKHIQKSVVLHRNARKFKKRWFVKSHNGRFLPSLHMYKEMDWTIFKKKKKQKRKNNKCLPCKTSVSLPLSISFKYYYLNWCQCAFFFSSDFFSVFFCFGRSPTAWTDHMVRIVCNLQQSIYDPANGPINVVIKVNFRFVWLSLAAAASAVAFITMCAPKRKFMWKTKPQKRNSYVNFTF